MIFVVFSSYNRLQSLMFATDITVWLRTFLKGRAVFYQEQFTDIIFPQLTYDIPDVIMESFSTYVSSCCAIGVQQIPRFFMTNLI